MAQNRDDQNSNTVDKNVRVAKETETVKTRDAEIRVPVVEEELAVGKRSVETGGVRVHQKVTETPVNESVSLHEERVTIDRHPVDREVRPEDMKAFKDSTFEMREMSEEAVVAKKARVVEEVVVGKEERNRTEHISDTVRRTDVEIEQIQGRTTRSGYESVEPTFRTHHTKNFASSGMDFDNSYSHAYRYGYDLSEAEKSGDWSSIENEVHTTWETRNKGTWEKFKDAIRYGFESGRK